MEPYFDTGPYKREITTKSREAEVWFNRGLNWCYAFHHKEALRCFEKMIKLDPDCAMGYWGVAMPLVLITIFRGRKCHLLGDQVQFKLALNIPKKQKN